MSSQLKFLRREITQRVNDAIEVVLNGGISHEEYLRLTSKIQAYRECLAEITHAEGSVVEDDFDMPGGTRIDVG